MKLILSFLVTFSFTCILIAQENGGPYSPDNNTVLLMHFDGNAINSSAVGNNGIVHGSGVSFETGIHGQCLRLDNSTADKQSWVEVPFYDELNFTEEFSIECWFKINSWGENHTRFPFILIKRVNAQADYEIRLHQEYNSLSATFNCVDDNFNRAGAVNTTDIIESGKWYHIAVYFNFSHKHLYLVMRDESFKEVYANHKYIYTQAFSTNDKLFIGFANNNETFFDGWIDELRISNKYLKHQDDVVSNINIAELKDSVQPLLRDKWKVYQWPFMAYFPKNTETGELHKGNSCGMTASMRLIHYWEHPRFPIGNIDFMDQNYHWLADFDNTEYRFDEMPYSFGSNPAEEDYDAAASMIAQIGAAEIKYGIGGGGAPIKTILEKYFKYNSNLKFVYREEYTKTEWENIFKNELSNGRPILIEGTAERYDDGNWAGHFYVCDGYSADNKFHTDLSIGEIEWWTDIDNFEYGKNQCALIYAEPDWQGKTLSLDYPKGDEYFQKLTEIELKWSSTNINNVLLEYSNDAGKNWHKIAENVDASTGNYNWTLPDVASEEFKIRISDSENGNVYQRCKTFNVFNQQSIAFYYPLKNTYFQAETTQPIYWNSEGIQSFKLEYSTGQNNWELLSDAVIAKSGVSNCIMPDLNEDKVILKATDLSNSNLFFLTDTFKIKSEKLIGGVNNSDEQTVLLMHFEENIENSANNYLTPNESVSGSFSENYNLALGKAYRIDNSKESIYGNYMWVTNAEDIDLGNNLTVEAWVNINSIGDNKTGFFPIIIEKAESFGIYVYQDFVGNELNGFHSLVNFSNGSKIEFFQRKKIELNKWYHVAMISDASSGTVNFFVHDENRNLIYKDSESFPSGSDGEIKQNDNLINIGGLGGASNRQFDGFMDEVRISKSSNLEDYLETTELPFYDDFSQNYLNWTTFSATGIDQWHISNDDGIDFSKCARFYITSNPQQTNDDWLITPVFNSVGVSKLVISFSYIYTGNGIKPEYYYASSFNTNPANTEWTQIDNSFLGEVGPWNNARIEITDPAEKFVFAIRYQSSANDSYYYLMDNFKIEEITTNLEKTQLAEPNFKIYPNPITHESVISFSIKSADRVILSIYDLQGRMICNLLDKKMNTGTHTIPLGYQIKSSGVYLCKLSTSEGVSILKLVVK